MYNCIPFLSNILLCIISNAKENKVNNKIETKIYCIFVLGWDEECCHFNFFQSVHLIPNFFYFILSRHFQSVRL